VIETSMTVPPIRRTIDVVAENYTTREVAEEANIFALKMANQQNVERLGDETMISSPFAVYQRLALLLSGAMGETARV
jgi:serine protease inhibitor